MSNLAIQIEDSKAAAWSPGAARLPLPSGNVEAKMLSNASAAKSTLPVFWSAAAAWHAASPSSSQRLLLVEA